MITKEDYVKIGKEHFFEVILPRLKAISSQVTDHLLVFIEGSVAYGYCDQVSDIDLDFYINMEISDEIKSQITHIFIGETYWKDSVRVSYSFGGEYWKIKLIVHDEMDRFWREFNPYAVNNLAQAIPVWDPQNLMPIIKEKVTFYPEKIKQSVIRGLWITINDSGEYNFKESLDRNKKTEARIFLYRAMEAMLRLSYILNHSYYPPTKWLSTGLAQLEHDFGLIDMITKVEDNEDLDDIYQLFMDVFNKMKLFMKAEQCIELECLNDYSSIFSKPFFIFKSF